MDKISGAILYRGFQRDHLKKLVLSLTKGGSLQGPNINAVDLVKSGSIYPMGVTPDKNYIQARLIFCSDKKGLGDYPPAPFHAPLKNGASGAATASGDVTNLLDLKERFFIERLTSFSGDIIAQLWRAVHSTEEVCHLVDGDLNIAFLSKDQVTIYRGSDRPIFIRYCEDFLFFSEERDGLPDVGEEIIIKKDHGTIVSTKVAPKGFSSSSFFWVEK